jgi:hypothetical protein
MDKLKKAENKPDGKEKGNIFDWVDVGLKVVIAGVGIWVSILGYQYQRSFTTSQLLVQQEKGDTDIRAQMFGKITDRLMKPSQKDKESLVQDALLAQMLALNFNELIELKPLMIDLDDQLGSEIERLKKAGTNTPDLEVKKKARESLRSVARRIRDRQVSALIHNPRPGNDAIAATDVDVDKGAGSIHYVSVLRKGPKDHNRCAVIDEDKNGCLGEVMQLPAPAKERAMYISIDSADWKKERFVVSLNCGKLDGTIVLPPPQPGEKEREISTVHECREMLKEGELLQTRMEAGHKSFEVTWFDFPFTDNTLQADGNRYAVFIDETCKDAYSTKPEDEPNAVRLGLLYFPKDYYPSRERPVSYKQLSDKLGLKMGN